MNYSDLSPPELFSACATVGDGACWVEFIRRFNPVIARSVIRVAMRHGSSDKSLIDDLVQETYLRICANHCRLLSNFIPQQSDSAFAFLKVVAANVAQDFFKSRLADKRAPEVSTEMDEKINRPLDVESPKSILNATERSVLIQQIDRKLTALLPPSELKRARTVFWLYYRHGFTASAIASQPTLGLTTKGVESMLLRLTRLLRQGLVDLMNGDSPPGKGIQQADSF